MSPASPGYREVRSIRELPAILGERGLRSVWTQLDNASAKDALAFTQSTLGNGETVPAQDVRELTKTLRSSKDPGEIELLRKAANASIKAQTAAILAIHPGVNERAISGVITGTLLANGCERPSYPSIVGSGINSTVLHYSADDATMQNWRCRRHGRSRRVFDVRLRRNPHRACQRALH